VAAQDPRRRRRGYRSAIGRDVNWMVRGRSWEVVGGGLSSLASRRSLEVDTYTRKAGRRPIEDALATVGVRRRREERKQSR
jgi:hypothetical protein